jgi:hypothetical protein
MNNLLYYFFIVVIVNIAIKLLIRFYSKYSTKAYLYGIDIERLVLLNGKTIDYILFKNIKPALNSDKLYIILNVIIQYLSNFYAKDTKLSIVFFDFNPKTGLYRCMSDGCVFEFTNHLSVNDLYNKIKWIKGVNNYNDIVVVIKTL